MSLKKGMLWALHLMVSLIFEFRSVFILGWLFLGLGVVGAVGVEHWWIWPAGFVLLMLLEGAAHVMLNGGPLDPRRLSPNGNFAE